MLKQFLNDEHGVILSAELVLVGTILILGMIVGLVELQCAVVAELSDLGDAIGNVDQSYRIPGITSYKANGGVKAQTAGAAFNDGPDAGDCNSIITCDNAVSGGEKSSLSAGAFGTTDSRGYRSDNFSRQSGNSQFHESFDHQRGRTDAHHRSGVIAPEAGDEFCPPEQIEQRPVQESRRIENGGHQNNHHQRRSDDFRM